MVVVNTNSEDSSTQFYKTETTLKLIGEDMFRLTKAWVGLGAACIIIGVVVLFLRTQTTLILPDEQYMLLLNEGKVPFNGISQSVFIYSFWVSVMSVVLGSLLVSTFLIQHIRFRL